MKNKNAYYNRQEELFKLWKPILAEFRDAIQEHKKSKMKAIKDKEKLIKKLENENLLINDKKIYINEEIKK